jgi:hypothetical protein
MVDSNHADRSVRARGCGVGGRLAAAIGALCLLGACGGAPPITSCEPAAGITPDCRFQDPEDIVVSPEGQFLLVSQMGGMEGERPGTLVSLAPATGTIEVLFPRVGRVMATQGWGDPACAPPALFAPHGIDIERLDSGVNALYAVNHGVRESIEMFEVLEEPDDVRLIWRGCVVAPDHGFFNDLVVLRNGDFWVSQMYPRGANAIWTVLRMQFTDHAPGYAYHWSPGGGFARIAGSDAKFANGVEKSQDERYLFLNSYFGDEVIKVDTVSGNRIGSAAAQRPDNLSWSPTGELLVASHRASIPDSLACMDLQEGSCGFGFQILAVDTQTMQPRVLLDHEGPPMGAATVAVPLGDQVYLGTFAGDRIARVDAGILERP